MQHRSQPQKPWWQTSPNFVFPRDGRCLLFARHSTTLRDCHACRAIAWCPHYDFAALRQPDRLALDHWENEGGAT